MACYKLSPEAIKIVDALALNQNITRERIVEDMAKYFKREIRDEQIYERAFTATMQRKPAR